MDVPGKSSKVASDIEKFGQSLIGVYPRVGEADVPFMYTIGNATVDLPELLLIGKLEYTAAASLLNMLGCKMRNQGSRLGSYVSLGGEFSLKLREASALAKEEYTIQAGQFLDHENYNVLQVLIPDRTGLYPGEPGIDPVYDVPLV